MLSKLRLHPLYFYLGSALFAQLLFFRAVSVELGLDQLGYLAQFVAIAFVASGVVMFGCENSIGHVILSKKATADQHRVIGFHYVIGALGRSAVIAVPLCILAAVFLNAEIGLLALIVLLAFNTAFSFIERAVGKHSTMVLMDSRTSFAALAIAYYAGGFMPRSAVDVIGVVAILEAGKFAIYALIMAGHFSLSSWRAPEAAMRVRLPYALNGMLSIISNYGIPIILPMMIGPAHSGVFFLIQRIVNPLTFALNAINSITTARIVRQFEQIKQIYLSSVKELAAITALAVIGLLIIQGPLLEFFNVSQYRFEFILMLGGVAANLLTGASAAVFNSADRPRFNSWASIGFIFVFLAAVAIAIWTSNVELRVVAWAFLIANIAKNLVVLFGIRQLRREAIF